MKTERTGLWICIGLALAGLLSGLGMFIAFKTVGNNDRQVYVKGLCEREVTANKVTWPLVYKLTGNDLLELNKQIEADNKIVTDFLKTAGMTAEEITVSAPKVFDRRAQMYSSDGNNEFRYTVTVVVTVTSGKVDLVNRLIAEQGQLLKSGIAVVTGDYEYQTIYEYTLLNEIKPEMIAEATQKAREAAEQFAFDSGSRIGRLKTAYQGQFTIEDRDPYTPHIKKIRVVTSLTYSLVR